jgi:hypothetical protein
MGSCHRCSEMERMGKGWDCAPGAGSETVRLGVGRVCLLVGGETWVRSVHGRSRRRPLDVACLM